jgi:hypothetical protein
MPPLTAKQSGRLLDALEKALDVLLVEIRALRAEQQHDGKGRAKR